MNAGALSFKLLGVGLLGLALLGVLWQLARAPAGARRPTGLRGLRREQALARSPLWRATEPLLGWLGARAEFAVPSAWQRRLDGYLRRRGDPLGLSPAELTVVTLVSFAAGLGLGAMLGARLSMEISLACMLAPLGAALPHLAVSHAAAQRTAQIRRRLPQTLDLVGLAMCAGSDFQGAVRHVTNSCSQQRDPLCEELRCMLRELRLGCTRQQALLALRDRIPLEEVAEFVAAAIQAEQQGTPLAQVLQTLAAACRTRRTVSAEAAASRAGVQMVLPLFLVFLSVMLLVMGPLLLNLTIDAAPGGPHR